MTRRSLTIAAVMAAGWLSISIAPGAPGDEAAAARVRERLGQLNSSSSPKRATAAKALGGMGPKAAGAMPALKRLMTDKTYVRVVTTINGKAMLRREHQPVLTVGYVAARALVNINPSAALEVMRTGPEVARYHLAWWASEGARESGRLDMVLLAAKDPVGRIRHKAAEGLAKSKDHRAFKLLLAAMKDSAPQVRSVVVHAIGKRNDPARIDDLLDVLLRDRHHYPRGVAAYHLGAFDDPKIIASLITAMEDPNAFVRKHAADSLSQHPSDEVTEALIDALSDIDPDVTRAALRGLTCVKSPVAAKRMLPFLNHRHPEAREMATKIMGYFPDDRLDDLLKALDCKTASSARYAAAEALGRTTRRDGRIVPALVRRHRKEQATHYLTALAALGTADAVKALEGILFDEKLTPGSRAMVARALGTVGANEARAALARLADHPNPQLRKEARAGLTDRARKEYPRAPTLARPAPRERGRWPSFALYWGGEHWKRSDGGRSKDAVSGRFVLSGIMGSGAGGMAIINGKILRVGDSVSGGKVVAIAKDRVRLESNGKPMVLTLK